MTLLPFIGLLGGTALAIVPSPLIEPRYFIVPYLLFRLHLGPADETPAAQSAWRRAVRIELAFNAIVSAATLYVFLYRPFAWPSEPGRLQRFMW